jgi:hypothetical protein
MGSGMWNLLRSSIGRFCRNDVVKETFKLLHAQTGDELKHGNDKVYPENRFRRIHPNRFRPYWHPTNKQTVQLYSPLFEDLYFVLNWARANDKKAKDAMASHCTQQNIVIAGQIVLAVFIVRETMNQRGDGATSLSQDELFKKFTRIVWILIDHLYCLITSHRYNVDRHCLFFLFLLLLLLLTVDRYCTSFYRWYG